MAVNQTGREIGTAEGYCFSRLVITDAHDASVVDSDVAFVNFTAEHIDDARVFEEQFSGSFTTSHSEAMIEVPHTCRSLAHHAPALEQGKQRRCVVYCVSKTIRRTTNQRYRN